MKTTTPRQLQSLRLSIQGTLIGIALTTAAFAQTYSVSGTAELQDSTDHSGITVAIYRGPVLDTVTTDQYGDYYFNGLTFGRYYFKYTKPGHVPRELNDIEIADNMFLPGVVLDTIPDTTHIRGTARLAGTTDHAGITVSAVTGTGTLLDTTGTTGTYEFTLLSGTALSLSFRYPGFYADALGSLVAAGSLFVPDTVFLDSAYLLTGSARYGNTAPHAGITVTSSTADSAFHGTASTDDSGTYSITLPDSGMYTVAFSAPGYLPATDEHHITAYRTDLATVWLDTVPPGTTYYGGTLDRDTRWTTASERHIREDFTIGAGVTLIIEAGTAVRISPNDSLTAGTDVDRVEFRIQGALDCRGTRSDPVTFQSESAAPGPGDWRGIEILPGADTCRITNTTVKHGFWGIKADTGTGLLLDSCRLAGNINGFDITATPLLMDGTVTASNSAAAGNVTDCRFVVTDCRFMNNGSNGPGFHGGRGAFFNNLVYANRGTRGITITDSIDIVLCNNTIENNGNYGIDANRARAVIINNVITDHRSYGINNSTQAYGTGIEIAYNCMWFNGLNFRNCPDTLLGGRRTVNANGDTCDGRYNLFYTPALTAAQDDRLLGPDSKCRGAGTALFYSVQLDDTVRVYNKDGGLPHIGRDYDMAAAVTFDTAATDSADSAGITAFAIRNTPDFRLPCPVTGFAQLLKILPAETPVYTVTGRLAGTVQELAGRNAGDGVYVIAVPRYGTVLPVRTVVRRR